MGDAEETYLLPIVSVLREKGIAVEIYPDSSAKMKKQMSYANIKDIPFVVIAGENEIKDAEITLKNMHDGTQERFKISNLLPFAERISI